MLRENTTHAALTRAMQHGIDTVAEGDGTSAVAVLGQHHRFFMAADYWSTDLSLPSKVREAGVAFERLLAFEGVKHRERFGALVVPVIYRDGDAGSHFRNPHKEMVDGESRMLFGITWDVREGFDIHRLFYSRRPNGDPVFGDVESLNGASRLPHNAPGSALIQSVLQPGGSPA